MGGGGGGGNEDFVDIWGGGGVSNRTSFRGHFYAILGPLLSSLYRIQNGDILGVAQISVLFIYLFIFKLKMRKFDMLILKPCTDGSTNIPHPWRITKL